MTERRIDQLPDATDVEGDDYLLIQDTSAASTRRLRIDQAQAALAGSLQQAYDAGPAPEIATDPSRGPVSIKTYWDPASGETVPNAIVLRVDAGPLGILEGLSLSPSGLSSAEDIEIKPAEAPTGEAGKVLRLHGGDSSDHPTGGRVSIVAGSGHSGHGEVEITAGEINSGIGSTPWDHSGDLSVTGVIESSEVQTRRLKTPDNLTVDIPNGLTLNAGEINSGMSNTPWNHSGDLTVTGAVSAKKALKVAPVAINLSPTHVVEDCVREAFVNRVDLHDNKVVWELYVGHITKRATVMLSAHVLIGDDLGVGQHHVRRLVASIMGGVIDDIIVNATDHFEKWSLGGEPDSVIHVNIDASAGTLALAVNYEGGSAGEIRVSGWVDYQILMLED